MPRKSRRIRLRVGRRSEQNPARIVSDPRTAQLSDGKRVPLVVIDTRDRPDIEALFASHSRGTVGDIALQWGRRTDAPSGTVTLFVQFTRPAKLLLILDFEIVRQGVVVDEILRMGELFLQGVKPGEQPGSHVRTSRIRVVVPDTKFAPIWEDLLIEELAARARVHGASAHQAKLIARESVRKWRTGPH